MVATTVPSEGVSTETVLIHTIEPANAAMHGPHSLVRIGAGCA